MQNTINLSGNKVVLRTIEEQDGELLLGLINDPEIAKVTGGYPQPSSYSHQLNWFCSMADPAGSLRCVIADRKYPSVGLGIVILSHVGLKGRTAEIYIKLAGAARGKGFGQDAVNILVSYAFREFQMDCIYSSILESNGASRRLFEKCGFKQEGVREGRADKDGNCRNVCVYAIRNRPAENQ